MLPDNTKASVIRFPSGKFGFVGKVPVDLAYEYEDFSDVKVALSSGAGIARKIAEREGRVFKPRTWDTEAEALAYAVSLAAVSE